MQEKHRPIYGLLAEAAALLERKAADYSDGVNAHSNFVYSAMVAAPFNESYTPYAVMIGTKLIRIAELLKPGRIAVNESIQDSFLDLINYCALMAERYTVEQSASGVRLVDQAPGVWIDVSETLPLDDETVLVWGDGQMYVSSHLRRHIEAKGREGEVKWMHLPMAPQVMQTNRE